MSQVPEHMEKKRRELSERFLEGNGIEIGALHAPLWTSPRAAVKYVDRLDVAGLRAQYPELGSYDLAPVHIIDDGERLSTIPDASLDFIIANHMLEHCENPLGSMRNHVRKVKTGSLLYYAVPDKRFTFDQDRPITTFDHLVRDDAEGTEWSRTGHYDEWTRLVDKKTTPEEIRDRMHALMSVSYRIHFHVWDDVAFKKILAEASRYLGHPFEVAHLEQNDSEIIAVLRKRSEARDTPSWGQRALDQLRRAIAS